MKKKVILWFLWLLGSYTPAYTQELFVFTEPASNMATNNLGVRLTSSVMKEKPSGNINIYLMPELMYGVSSKLMVHTNAFLSRESSGSSLNGGSIYAKYKFINQDEVQKHFRMAIYSRYSFNTSHIHQESINLMMNNSGFETGLIATQLLHKLALSGSVSYIQALNNGNNNDFPQIQVNNATNYTFSIGRLILPKKYKDYDQTNMNLMLEFLGQTLNENGKTFLDIAPSVQFIINSKVRIDVAYRQEIYSNMYRFAPNGVLIRFEYNFFNIF